MFIGVYYAYSAEENIKIMNKYITGPMTVDEKAVSVSSYYKFSSPGYHIVKANIVHTLWLYEAFMRCNKLINITFTPSMDISTIEWFDPFFEGSSRLEYVKFMKKLYAPEILWYNKFFAGCSSLKAIDFSYIYGHRASWIYEFFLGYSSLTSIDVSTFSSHSFTESFFSGIPGKGTIKINKNLHSSIRSQIPSGWEIITVD